MNRLRHAYQLLKHFTYKLKQRHSKEHARILQEIAAANSSLTSLAIFVRYGVGDSLPPWQQRFLSELAGEGWAIWIVDNSPHPLSINSRQRIPCTIYLRRENTGMCIGAYAHAIDLLHHALESQVLTQAPERLALINDSFLPLCSLAKNQPLQRLFFHPIQDDHIRSLTESCEQHYHLQSYMLVLGQSAWRSTESKQQWQRCRRLSGRKQVIEGGEISLSRCWHQQGLHLFPSLPLSDLAQAGNTRIPVERNDILSSLQQNAYLVYWRELIQLSGILKKSTLTDLHQSRISQATIQEFLELCEQCNIPDGKHVIDFLVRQSSP